MNHDVKKQWAAALRSGLYKQGLGQLRHGDYFCVMGVLCNLHAQAHPAIAAKQRSTDSYMGTKCVTPTEVLHWAGLQRAPSLSVDDQTRSIYTLNDIKHLSFNQFADLIEKQL